MELSDTQLAKVFGGEDDMGMGDMGMDAGMDPGMSDMQMDPGMGDMQMDPGMSDMQMDPGMGDMQLSPDAMDAGGLAQEQPAGFTSAVLGGDDQDVSGLVHQAAAVPQDQQPRLSFDPESLNRPVISPQQIEAYDQARERALQRIETQDRVTYDRNNLPPTVQDRISDQIRNEPRFESSPPPGPQLPPEPWRMPGRPHDYDRLGRPGNPFGPVGPRLVPPGR